GSGARLARGAVARGWAMLRDLMNGAAAGCAATGPMSAAMAAMHLLLPRQEQYPLPPRQITEEAANKVGVNDELAERHRRALTRPTSSGGRRSGRSSNRCGTNRATVTGPRAPLRVAAKRSLPL